MISVLQLNIDLDGIVRTQHKLSDNPVPMSMDFQLVYSYSMDFRLVFSYSMDFQLVYSYNMVSS